MSIHKENKKNTSCKSSLEIYLKEINKIELLTKEKEIYHARRAKEGDNVSKEKLITANLRFVVRVAKKYQHMGLYLEDLISEGNIGLIKAIEKYDVNKGYRFISYAVWWIRQRILRALYQKSRMIRLPMNKICKIMKIERLIEKLEDKEGIEVKIGEIAKHLSLDEECAGDLLFISRGILSLDSPFTNETDLKIPLVDFIKDNMTKSPEESAINSCLRDDIKSILQNLEPREAEIITYRFGFNGKKACSLEDVGNRFHMTRERVRQIVKRVMEKLKNNPMIQQWRN